MEKLIRDSSEAAEDRWRQYVELSRTRVRGWRWSWRKTLKTSTALFMSMKTSVGGGDGRVGGKRDTRRLLRGGRESRSTVGASC